MNRHLDRHHPVHGLRLRGERGTSRGRARTLAAALALAGSMATATAGPVLAQTPPPFEAYRAWAARHLIELEHPDSRTDAGLEALTPIIGAARVLAISEPFHGAHEPLAFRNRLIEHLVRHHGFNAIALETGLATSKLLHDYALGEEGNARDVANTAFSYGFGALRENIELLEWLRSYNRSVPAERTVGLYGVDLTGQEFPFAYRTLEVMDTTLARVRPPEAAALRDALSRVKPHFRADVYATLTAAQRDGISVVLERLATWLDRERAALIEALGDGEYAWLRRQAVNAQQDDAFLRSLEEGPWALREVAIADNLRWVVERAGPDGRTLFFANNSHTGSHRFSPGHDVPAAWPVAGTPSAGWFLRRDLGPDLVTIGTYFGEGDGVFWYLAEDARTPPIREGGMDALLRSAGVPAYAIDLRRLPDTGVLHTWMHTEHESRTARFHLRYAPATAFDALLWLDRLTPARR